MAYVRDFFLEIAELFSNIDMITSAIVQGVKDSFSALFDFISNIPLWIAVPIYAMIALAVVFQIISFIPTESGGH